MVLIFFSTKFIKKMDTFCNKIKKNVTMNPREYLKGKDCKKPHLIDIPKANLEKLTKSLLKNINQRRNLKVQCSTKGVSIPV